MANSKLPGAAFIEWVLAGLCLLGIPALSRKIRWYLWVGTGSITLLVYGFRSEPVRAPAASPATAPSPAPTPTAGPRARYRLDPATGKIVPVDPALRIFADCLDASVKFAQQRAITNSRQTGNPSSLDSLSSTWSVHYDVEHCYVKEVETLYIRMGISRGLAVEDDRGTFALANRVQTTLTDQFQEYYLAQATVYKNPHAEYGEICRSEDLRGGSRHCPEVSYTQAMAFINRTMGKDSEYLIHTYRQNLAGTTSVQPAGDTPPKEKQP
jgi:hypothetical protein